MMKVMHTLTFSWLVLALAACPSSSSAGARGDLLSQSGSINCVFMTRYAEVKGSDVPYFFWGAYAGTSGSIDSFKNRISEAKAAGLLDALWGDYAASNRAMTIFMRRYTEVKGSGIPDLFLGKYAASSCRLR